MAFMPSELISWYIYWQNTSILFWNDSTSCWVWIYPYLWSWGRGRGDDEGTCIYSGVPSGLSADNAQLTVGEPDGWWVPNTHGPVTGRYVHALSHIHQGVTAPVTKALSRVNGFIDIHWTHSNIRPLSLPHHMGILSESNGTYCLQSQSQSLSHRVNGALQTNSSYRKPWRFIVRLKAAQGTLCFYDR